MGLVERRIGLVFALFLLGLVVAGARAAQLGAFQNDRLKQSAVSQQVDLETVPAKRGTITDRHGEELAVSQDAAGIAATPYRIKDPRGVAEKIAGILGRDPADVLDAVTRRNTGFAWIARQVPMGTALRIKALGVDGISLIPESRRTYPRGSLASQVLGTVGIDGDGLSGLEYGRDKLLSGHDGERRLVNDGLGKPIELEDVKPARPGERLTLTIDARIQDRVEEVLAGVGATYRPKGATAIVTDPRSGEILALANWPRVDANDVAAAPDYARMDRAVAASYEPGSTFKAVTVAGALTEGLVKPDTVLDLPPTITLYDRTIGESHARGPVSWSVAEILAKSSNIGAIKIGLMLGRERFDRWVRRFGFGDATGIDLPGEATGIVPKVSQYSGSSMGNLPIGQGLAVTPIQMATAYGAIANGGVLRPAHVVRAIAGKPVATPKGRRVIAPAVASSLRTMLEGVLAPGGTASEAAIPGYALAGKTGTANKPDPTTGGYSQSKYVASFVGFAPARRPRLLVAVMVDEPQGAIYGGQVAAPAFQKIVSFALPYLRIPPQ